MTTPPRHHVLLAAIAGGALVVSLSAAAHVLFDTPPAQPLTGAVVFGGIAMLAVPASRLHPFPALGAANVVTMLRAALVAVAAGFVVARPNPAVAWLLVLVGTAVMALDGLDGWLARRAGLSSAFGARFDMEVDAFFLLVLSVLVWRNGKAGSWVIAIGLMRYVFVAAGWRLPFMRGRLEPTRRGRGVAVLQMAVLSGAMVPLVPPVLSAAACVFALATLVWSFAIDVRRLYVA